MSGSWPKLLVALLLVAVAVTGAWLYARYDVRSRITGLPERVQALGAERGLESIPSEEAVAERVQGFAAELGLELEELEVTVEELEGAELGQVDAVARRLPERVRGMERSAVTPGADPAAGPGPGVERVPMQLTGSVIEVRARVRGAKWLWSWSDRVQARRVLGRRIR